MKKTLVSALTTAMVVGAASTTFAAANPFSDVPAGHWAYDACAQLAADGVIEGYGDGTFRGDQEITRYEMAQMVAKAMAKNPTGADKAMLDRLAAEFSDELNNLGVRVSNLEKHSDMVKWNGKVEYTTTKTMFEKSTAFDGSENTLLFRLEPQAEVNKNWTVNARLDAAINAKNDNGTVNDSQNEDRVALKRAWAQGDYKNFQVKLGKMELYTNERGLLWDTEYSGAQVTFGKDLKATLMAGRVSGADNKIGQGLTLLNVANVLTDDATNLFGINLQYDKGGKGLYGGAAWYRASNDIFKILSNSNKDKASIWSLNAGYRFSNKAAFWASYARNHEAAYQNHAWQAEFDYGTYNNAKDKGSWGAYLAYRKLGVGASFMATTDGVQYGTKGFEIGAAYAPFKNVGVLAKYFKGKTIDGDMDASKLFGRVELFF